MFHVSRLKDILRNSTTLGSLQCCKSRRICHTLQHDGSMKSDRADRMVLLSQECLCSSCCIRGLVHSTIP